MRASILMAALWMIASVALGCAVPTPAPPTPTSTAIPSPTPAPTPTTILGLIRASPRELVLQREDLPGGFNLGGQQSELPDEWSVLYMRPDAVHAKYNSLANLVSAIASVRVLTDQFQALQAYREQEKLIPTDIASALGQATGKPEDVAVERITLVVPMADRATGYRVAYRIGNVRLHEYRFVLLSGNGVARLMFTALAEPDGSEPARLRELVEAIAVKQAERLLSARRRMQ
jgi:hypothetical protein